ncbi:MAG TPA: hypothetical protein VFX61_10440 [Micromonosporaceae bacterium]|nr:hypothetical protein [Micromonosporaceae bacterium]
MLLAALISAVAVGPTGCGSNSGHGDPEADATTSALPQQRPIDALQAAGQALTREAFKLRITPGRMSMVGEGVVDPIGRTAAITMGFRGSSYRIEVIMLGDDFYLRLSGFEDAPEQWLHLAASAASGRCVQGIHFDDLARFQTLSAGILDVKWDGDRRLKGTVDLIKPAKVDKVVLNALEEKATEVPFIAKVDDQGRLVDFHVGVRQVAPTHSQDLGMTYSDFGTTVEVEAPPASETIEMPARVLRSLSEDC